MIVYIMKHITGSVSTHNTNLGGFPLHYDVVGAISCGKVISRHQFRIDQLHYVRGTEPGQYF